jgi:hypothetical protein
MIRRIICKECHRPQHPEDVANGWKQRTVEIVTKKPADHSITICEGAVKTVHPLASIVCDGCNKTLSDGAIALAVTQWQSKREGEPLNWEQEFSQ